MCAVAPDVLCLRVQDTRMDLLRPILTQLMLCNPDGSFCMLQYHELMQENCNKQKALDDALQKLHGEIDKRTKMQNEQELRRVDNCRIQQELDMLQTRLAQEQVTLFLSCSCQYTTQGSQQCNFGRLRCISCCCGICDASYCGDSQQRVFNVQLLLCLSVLHTGCMDGEEHAS